MWHKALMPTIVVGVLMMAGCQQLERLTLVRPSAHARGYTQVAPKYDVSGKKGKEDEDPFLLMASASKFLQDGQLEQAEHTAQQLLKVTPGSADANTLLGLIADARGKKDQAGKYFQAAVAASPKGGVYANNYGNWLCANGKPGDALPWFETAVADPNYPTPIQALVNAGNCASAAALPERAEASWRRVLAQDPAHLDALAGMATLEFGQKRYFEARAFVERWLAVEPNSASGLQLAAEIEQKLGDNVAASRYLSRLSTLPSSGSATVQAPRQ